MLTYPHQSVCVYIYIYIYKKLLEGYKWIHNGLTVTAEAGN